jgi:hypothetical protein
MLAMNAARLAGGSGIPVEPVSVDPRDLFANQVDHANRRVVVAFEHEAALAVRTGQNHRLHSIDRAICNIRM